LFGSVGELGVDLQQLALYGLPQRALGPSEDEHATGKFARQGPDAEL
jgi:hypothetical protein